MCIRDSTNTIPILKVCPQNRGYGKDIFGIQGDEDPQNHWIYDHEQYRFPIARKLLRFLRMHDGVHVLLMDRSEIGNHFVPDRGNTRDKAGWVYSDYAPAHLHHNWRFSNIYEESEEFARKRREEE
eukprot:TRINITY_DN1487_c0_g1_i5.p1 TRINITY_DN1487_c0_g1~~TRINITY_DN1487_c0_g1_i5.p1  ORF type:complete len:126 (-),score=33.93 TRINITY_DN1487_c0_g1_i5:139-516(-)